MFDHLRLAFESLFGEGTGEVGGSVSVFRNGGEAATFAGGATRRDADWRPWDTDTLVPVFSATKGPAAATLLAVLERRGMHWSEPISCVWSAVGRGAGARATFADVLAHRAGLPALGDPAAASVFDFEAVIAALEAEEPLWPPGRDHAYHPRTFGFLLDHLVRRITGGDSLGVCWDAIFRRPFGLDFWIGLPESEFARMARLYPARAGSPSGEADARFYAALRDPESLPARAFRSPSGVSGVGQMNSPAVWSAGFPAFGGVASARGLAAFYSLLAEWRGAVDSGRAGTPGGGSAPACPLAPETLELLTTRLSQGEDRVLLRETAFSCGFMLDPIDAEGRKKRVRFGPSRDAFGHPGAGGSVGFADAERGIGFAFVMNQMELTVLPGARAGALVEAAYRDLADAPGG